MACVCFFWPSYAGVFIKLRVRSLHAFKCLGLLLHLSWRDYVSVWVYSYILENCWHAIFLSSICLYVSVCVSFCLSGAVGGHRSDSGWQAEQIIDRQEKEREREIERGGGFVQNGILAYCLLCSIQLLFVLCSPLAHYTSSISVCPAGGESYEDLIKYVST